MDKRQGMEIDPDKTVFDLRGRNHLSYWMISRHQNLVVSMISLDSKTRELEADAKLRKQKESLQELKTCSAESQTWDHCTTSVSA